jgi:hypothetical protein
MATGLINLGELLSFCCQQVFPSYCDRRKTCIVSLYCSNDTPGKDRLLHLFCRSCKHIWSHQHQTNHTTSPSVRIVICKVKIEKLLVSNKLAAGSFTVVRSSPCPAHHICCVPGRAAPFLILRGCWRRNRELVKCDKFERFFCMVLAEHRELNQMEERKRGTNQ